MKPISSAPDPLHDGNEAPILRPDASIAPGKNWSALNQDGKAANRASLERRLRFLASWRNRIDGVSMRLGQRRSALSEFAFTAGTVVYDLVETVRMGSRPDRIGRAYLDAIAAPVRLPQDPRYRGYWYDPERHSLVGLPIGLDLHHRDGVFHVIESNIAPGMSRERRSVYSTEIDPLLTPLAEMARRLDFETLVLCRRHWSATDMDELARAEREFGVRIIGKTVHSDERGTGSAADAIGALPEPLSPRTFYVLLSPIFMTPLIHFLNDKSAVGEWLPKAITAACGSSSPILSVPTYVQLTLPDKLTDTRWPNLVVKLAAADRGRGIVMGRFETEEDARRHLGMAPGDTTGRDDIPRVLATRRSRLLGMNPAQRVIYQPYVPPSLVKEHDGDRGCVIRMHVLISPLADAFLSAHGKVGSKPIPDHLPVGIITDHRPFVVNLGSSDHYIRLDEQVEAELREAALAYGKAARSALSGKFETAPA